MIHVLRTRSPVYSPLRAFSLDLHVLGTPPAFVLSQDQTLQLENRSVFLAHLTRVPWLTGTRLVHSKHCEFRNPSSWTCYPVFRDRPNTPFPLRTSNDLVLPPCRPPRRGTRFLPLPTAARQGPSFRPGAYPEAAGAAVCSRPFRGCQLPRPSRTQPRELRFDSSAARRIRRRHRFFQTLPDQIDLLASPRHRGLRLDDLHPAERLLERPQKIIE